MSQLREVAEGLSILLTYDKEDKAHVCAEHDEVYIGGPPPGQIEPQDRKRLTKLGFTWESDYDGWHRYV